MRRLEFGYCSTGSALENGSGEGILTGLTARELEVLALVAQGRASKEIADELKISVNTVNNHRAAMFVKLKVHSATAAVKWYWENSRPNPI